MKSHGELPNLDALRALAVLLVFADHVLETVVAGVGTYSPFDRYLGRLGVLLFFVHTCFVLMLSLERHGGSGWSLARAFYIRRIFRLYPLAIVCVLAVTAFGVPFRPWGEFRFPEPFDLAANLALVTNLTGSPDVLAPLWTLPVELQMYVFLPAIFGLVTRDPMRVTLLYLLSLGAALLLPGLSPRLSLFACAPAFMAGVVAYVWRRHATARLPGWAWLPFLLAMVVVYVVAEELTPGVHHLELAAASTLAVGLAMPLFAQSSAGALNQATRIVARYSYGIYLFNLIALWAAYYALPIEAPAAKALTALTLLVVLAVAGYHLVEAPMMGLGKLGSGPDFRRPEIGA
jgi:peptidoglycan/LPS O-acetylase OafA/YrhL